MFTRIFYQGLAQMLGGTPTSPTVKTYLGQIKTTPYGLENYVKNFSSAVGQFCTSPKTDAYIKNCVAFGDGNVPVTMDDYNLSGDHIRTYTALLNRAMNDDFDTSTVTYTITNTGTQAFTIREVGVYVVSSSSDYTALAYREVLPDPLTIEPNGVGQVTLTFNVNIPES